MNQRQAAQFAKDLKSRLKSSQKVVNEHLIVSRQQMKTQFDKTVRQSQFTVGDTVMLWKPYKRKGVSGCFQPKWDGPWSIVKFTGNGNTNCKIVKCNDPSKKLNVHVNQLKLVKTRDKMNVLETQAVEK